MGTHGVSLSSLPVSDCMNVFRKNEKISIAIAEYDLTSALKKMTYGSIFPVEVHRIALIDSLKYLR